VVRRALILVALVGCNARLGGPSRFVTGNDGGGHDDAGSGSTIVADARPDAAPVCSNGRVIYLNFEGATLTQAQTASDATANKAVWMGVASATLPKFRPGAADRATQIADTVTAFEVPLAGHPEIQVVTTRPAAGPFFEIGFGGAAQTVNVPYLYAVNRLDCGDTATKNDLAYVFEAAESPQRAANFALGALLFGLGATGTTDPNDCMCGWLTNCSASNNACTYSTAITAATGCPNVSNPVDETTYLDKFCN
jgi:hypothetical protein